MTQTELHLALLLNDTPMPNVLQNAGDYLQQFKNVFNKAADSQHLVLTWDAFDVVNKQEYPSLADVASGKYDAILLTGSKHNAHDNDLWITKLLDFINRLQTDHVVNTKLVGICFGHQIILRAAGGVTGRNNAGWELGWTQVKLNQDGQSYFKTNKQHICINQFHQDHVSVLPIGYRSLAFTEGNTPNHVTVSDNGQCLTIQGHPEFSRDTMRTMLTVRRDTGVLQKDVANNALKILEDAPPEMADVWFAEKALDFIRN
ncbi:class I glutamine amidotransferase-like protein [Parasitella parasitica]|nr:class I glutamine amidotransferase-like protein [Parasitella parasitica]